MIPIHQIYTLSDVKIIFTLGKKLTPINPNEVQAFDAIYYPVAGVRNWAVGLNLDGVVTLVLRVRSGLRSHSAYGKLRQNCAIWRLNS